MLTSIFWARFGCALLVCAGIFEMRSAERPFDWNRPIGESLAAWDRADDPEADLDLGAEFDAGDVDGDAEWGAAAEAEADGVGGDARPSATQRLPERKRVRRIYRVTAYSDRGLTAAGVQSGLGQCAAPEDIPFGSIVHIPDLGRSFVVTDRTHRRFRTNTVDLFMSRRADCREFGRRYYECVITVPEKPARYASRRLASAAQRLSYEPAGTR